MKYQFPLQAKPAHRWVDRETDGIDYNISDFFKKPRYKKYRSHQSVFKMTTPHIGFKQFALNMTSGLRVT